MWVRRCLPDMITALSVPPKLNQDQRPAGSASGGVQHLQGSEVSMRYGLVAEVTVVSTGIFI